MAERIRNRRPDLFGDKAPRYEPILEDVLDRLCSRGTLTESDLGALKAAHCESRRRPNTRKLGYLVQVLKALNAEGTYLVPIPTAPVPAVRPTLLPGQFSQWSRLPTAEAQLAFLENGEVSALDLLLNAAMGLVAHLGLGERVAVGVLAHATPESMDADGFLWTPIHYGDPDGPRYRLPLTPDLVGLFRAGVAGCAGAGWEPSRLVESAGKTKGGEEVLAPVREQLDHAFAHLNAEFEATRGKPESGRRIGSWRRFAHDARFLALRYGVPGFFLTAVRDYPLPAEVAAFDPARSSGSRIERSAPPDGSLPDLRATPSERPAGPVTLYEGDPPEDWSRQVQNLLRAFADRADELAIDGVIKGEARKTLDQYAREQLERADGIAPGTSLLHLALLWGFSLLVPNPDQGGAKNRVKVSTLRTYFSRVFSQTLVSAPETWDLAEWDEETVEEVTARVLATKKWGSATRQYFRESWANFLRFSQSYGLLPEVTVVAGQRGDLPGRPRSEILKPTEADRLFRYLYRPELRSTHIHACALVLGAYGGLRASEVVGLTLADVVLSQGAVWVRVRAGKTDAARRWIPLHKVAPPDQAEALSAWVGKRQAEFQQMPASDRVALFGPYQEPERYSRAGLIDPLLTWLRRWVGSGVDFHLLRHTAASWLLARWYVAAYGDETMSLPHGWAFSQEGLDGAHELLSGRMADQEDEAGGLLRLAKFMGHTGQDTLLQHYLHTLGWLHGWALGRAGKRGS